MALFPVQIVARRSASVLLKNLRINAQKRLIMTTRPRVEKVLEELRRNPYFDKYAEKIAKMQATNPDEFLQRMDEQEKKIQKRKVISTTVPQQYMRKSSWIPMSVLMKEHSVNYVSKRYCVTSASTNAYITTPIFYVNSGPHIGHLYSAVLADTITRYYKMLGYSSFLSTGTDEHGNKIKKAAENAKLPVHEYCTQISSQFQEMCDTFDIEYSRFIRTTEEQHRDAVHKFWNVLEEKDLIYLGKYSGWYCISDEAFLAESDLIEAKDEAGNTIRLSAESNNLVEWIEEDNYKFKLTALRDDLKYWLQKECSVKPAIFRESLLRYLNEDTWLQDLSISRPVSRVPWGIPTPPDPSQSVYVWLDALVNYLTSVGYPDDSYKKFWPPSVQIVGKDILKFHAIFWPAFLIGAGLEPPKTVLCHSHWVIDDQKMSKSKGNVILPKEAAEKFTESGLRYFLLRHSVLHSDTNYSESKIQFILNAELANHLGNLVRRCTNQGINPLKEIPPLYKYKNVLQSKVAIQHLENLKELRTMAQRHYEEYNLHNVVDLIMHVIHTANKVVDYHEPWNLAKMRENSNASEEVKAVISLVFETARMAALILHPIIPRLTNDILNFLKVPLSERSWNDAVPNFDSFVDDKQFDQSILLFKRIVTRR